MTLLLALVAMLAVAAVDAAVGDEAVLVELLVAGPLIAATGASVRATAVVALLAFVAAIPLGAVSDAFGETAHVTGVLVIVAGGLVAVVVARLRAARERAAARLEVQYGVARAIAEATSYDEAVPGLLEAIARPLGWELAQMWEMTEGGRLRLRSAWSVPGERPPDFEQASREMSLPRGAALPGQAWDLGRPIWLSEVVASGHFARAEPAERSGIRGGMAFPVRRGSDLVAVIELFSSRARNPDADMLGLTEALGAQIGEFIEGLRWAEAVRASEARKSAVLASSLDGVITMDHTGRTVEFNPAAERIFGRAAADVEGHEMAELLMPPSYRERHRRGLRRYVETGQASILGKRLELSGMRPDGSEFPLELAVNLIPGSEPPMFTATVRDITHTRRASEEREELLRLEQLARLSATQARDQLDAILRGVADAVTAQGPDGRLLFANDAAVTTLGFDSREALLSAPLASIMDRYELLAEDGTELSPAALPGRRALAEGVPDEAVVRFRVRATGEERWSAVKATPIMDGDGNVAMAINVIEDITDHKRAEMAQRLLAETSAVMAGSLDPDEVLTEVAELAVPELADWCAVDMLDESGLVERVALAHADPAQRDRGLVLGRRYPPDPNAPVGLYNVLRTGKAELYPEITEEMLRTGARDGEHLRILQEIGMRSAMIVPMVARGRALGVLSFVTGPSGRRFDDTDLEVVQELARRCAMAVDNARLYAERSYIARTLQESLLPSELPDIPGVEAAARFRPTGEGNEVGGDFYDMFEAGGRGWTVVMGDVCGKGPDAAAVTALARYTLRAAAMRERLPSRSLSLLNEALLRQRNDRRFCTVAYAYFEMQNGGARVGIASGGHPLPLLLRTDGSVEAVGAPGTLLGVVPNPRFEDRALTLSPGDSLIFYTDGVIESRSEQVGIDEEQLETLVAGCAGQGADAIAAAVEGAAMDAQGGSPRDDIAVLVLRVAG